MRHNSELGRASSPDYPFVPNGTSPSDQMKVCNWCMLRYNRSEAWCVDTGLSLSGAVGCITVRINPVNNTIANDVGLSLWKNKAAVTYHDIVIATVRKVYPYYDVTW